MLSQANNSASCLQWNGDGETMAGGEHRSILKTINFRTKLNSDKSAPSDQFDGMNDAN